MGERARSKYTSDDALQFGPFRLDAAAGVLWRHDEAVPLTPKAFAVLSHLAARPGRLVSKDELLDAVWPGVFVGDGVLKVTVREIRRALGDDPKAPAYVETAHRRGYRFVAPLTRVAPPASGAAEPTPVPGAPAGLEIPQVHYARSGDLNIAYQVIGDGPIDLVFVMGWVSHLEYFWKEPSFAAFLRRLASFSRLVLFDKRGTGLSDRVGALPTLEQRMDDVRAVMEAVGSTRAALLGVSEGGPMCSLFAASHPERTEALVMIGSYARRLWAPDYPWAPRREDREQFYDQILRDWGGPVGIEDRAPSRKHDPVFREWWATYLRMGASPGAAVALTRMNAEIDVRHVLRSVRVPTLVIHRTGDRCLLVEEGRFLAAQVPGAQFIELAGDDHLPFVGDQEAILDAVEAFLLGSRHALEPDRVLATVLVARLDGPSGPPSGGPEGRTRLLSHVRKELDWFRGRAATLGEERFTATFDGPARAIRCATAISAAAGRFGVPVRMGLHTGECDIGALGIGGPALEFGEQVASCAEVGEVLVSHTAHDLVSGSGITFVDRGRCRLGAGIEAQLYAVDRSTPPRVVGPVSSPRQT
jgi:pimeloyl-ACP methyl ester carboxylesterase